MSQFADPQFAGTLSASFEEGDSNAASKAEEAANVRRVEELFQTIVRGEFAALGKLLADEVEMEILGPAFVPMVGHHQGREQVIEAIRENFSLLEEQRPVFESVVAQGNQVALVGRERGRVRSTGRAYEIHLVQLFTLKDGKLVRMRQLFAMAEGTDAFAPTQE